MSVNFGKILKFQQKRQSSLIDNIQAIQQITNKNTNGCNTNHRGIGLMRKTNTKDDAHFGDVSVNLGKILKFHQKRQRI